MSSENNIQNIQQWHPKKITNYTPFDELETRPIKHSCRLNLKVNTVGNTHVSEIPHLIRISRVVIGLNLLGQVVSLYVILTIQLEFS